MAAVADLFTGVTHFQRGKTDQREQVPIDTIKGEVIGLYFSASWCPPCRVFTPILVEWYKKLQQQNDATGDVNKFEIIFLSSDRQEDAFNQYFDKMPWLALPFTEKDAKAKLSVKYQITGIPTLILIDNQTGSLITKTGRALVTDDPSGKKFPWKPPQSPKS